MDKVLMTRIETAEFLNIGKQETPFEGEACIESTARNT
jgi:hypothetical protein